MKDRSIPQRKTNYNLKKLEIANLILGSKSSDFLPPKWYILAGITSYEQVNSTHFSGVLHGTQKKAKIYSCLL